MNELKANIETIAAEQNRNPIDVITEMQTGAATLGNEEILEKLCELKREYI